MDTLLDNSSKVATKTEALVAVNQTLGAAGEEMLAAVSGLSESIQSVAGYTQTTDEMAKATQQEADAGMSAIADSIRSMKEIRESSHRISDIVKVISDIAAQTNLLALNASIEAARAGDSGRGFMVVANEVKELAKRSAEATQSISNLITESVTKVEIGSEVSQKAEDAFVKIVEGVKQTSLSLSEIANLSDQQRRAVEEVKIAISEVVSSTANSEAAATEIANAARGLQQVVDRLDKAIEQFTN